ncbi:MAG: hypothetical protein ACXWIT_21905, partial [Burkholderiales bacterium]
GNYVSNADYDALHEALALVLQTASGFFRQIAAGELTASDTDTTLGLLESKRGGFPDFVDHHDLDPVVNLVPGHGDFAD